MFVFILKLIGFFIIVVIIGFAWLLWNNAAKLEQEIKAEGDQPGEE